MLSWVVTLFVKVSSSIESGQTDIYRCVMSWGSGRSPGEGNGNLLRYACLGNAVDRGAWWATIHGITKSQTCLSTHTHVRTHTHTHTHPGDFFFFLFFFFLLQHKFIKCMLFLESTNLVSQIVDWRKADYCGRLTSLLLPLCPLAT